MRWKWRPIVYLWPIIRLYSIDKTRKILPNEIFNSQINSKEHWNISHECFENCKNDDYWNWMIDWNLFRQIQHEKNGGMCGECGDDWSLFQPRPHENGGIYGRGVIVKKWVKRSIIGHAEDKVYLRFLMKIVNQPNVSIGWLGKQRKCIH